MMIAVIRKSSGSSGVCHSGWTWAPNTTSSEPSEDWCIIGSTVPRAMKKNSTLFSFFLATFMPNFSRKTGENSIHITMM